MNKIFIQNKQKHSFGQNAPLLSYSEKTIEIINQFSSSKSILPHLPFPINHQDFIRQFILLNLVDKTNQKLRQGVIEIQYLNGSVYIGQFFTDHSSSLIKRQGRGFYKYQTGDIYLGDWAEDMFHGKGIYLNINGDAYQGTFFQGNCIFGKIMYSNGDIYDGEIKDGFKNGVGRMRYASRYEHSSIDLFNQEHFGEWKMDAKNGKGLFKKKQLEVKGMWQNGILNGQAQMIGQLDKVKFEFVGIFSNSEFVKGNLKTYFDQFSLYNGDVFKNQLDGRGKFLQRIRTNHYGIIDVQYCGEFKKGKINGKGSLKLLNSQFCGSEGIKLFAGEIYSGEDMDANGEILYTNGDFYRGQVKKGKKQGRGIYQYAYGDLYEGQFLNDLFHGPGKYFWAQNSLSYNGIFANGKIDLYHPGKYSF